MTPVFPAGHSSASWLHSVRYRPNNGQIGHIRADKPASGFDRKTLFKRGTAVAGAVLLSGGTQALMARGITAAPGPRVPARDNGGYGSLGPVRDMTTCLGP